MQIDKLVVDQYKPFNLGDFDSEAGFRLGGRSPAGVAPLNNSHLTRYLLTMPISQDQEISIFYSFDFQSDGDANPFDVAYTLFGQNNSLVELCVHAPSKRCEDGNVPSDIPGVSLVFQGGSQPEGSYEDSGRYPFHKVGGLPFFTHVFDSGIREDCDMLVNESFVHLLQLAFPVGPEDAVIDADWPFGEAVFHVFAKMENGSILFKYCWG